MLFSDILYVGRYAHAERSNRYAAYEASHVQAVHVWTVKMKFYDKLVNFICFFILILYVLFGLSGSIWDITS